MKLNIGVLGIMTRHKGIALVRGIWELLALEDPAIKLVLIGYFAEGEVIPNGVHFEATGEYNVADLPRLVLEAYLAYTGEPFTKETIDEIAELFVKHCGQAAGGTLAAYTQTHAQEASFLNDWVLELRRGV